MIATGWKSEQHIKEWIRTQSTLDLLQYSAAGSAVVLTALTAGARLLQITSRTMRALSVFSMSLTLITTALGLIMAYRDARNPSRPSMGTNPETGNELEPAQYLEHLKVVVDFEKAGTGQVWEAIACLAVSAAAGVNLPLIAVAVFLVDILRFCILREALRAIRAPTIPPYADEEVEGQSIPQAINTLAKLSTSTLTETNARSYLLDHLVDFTNDELSGLPLHELIPQIPDDVFETILSCPRVRHLLLHEAQWDFLERFRSYIGDQFRSGTGISDLFALIDDAGQDRELLLRTIATSYAAS